MMTLAATIPVNVALWEEYCWKSLLFTVASR